MRRPAVRGLVLLTILLAVGVMFVRARSGEDGPSAGAPPSAAHALAQPRRGTHERWARVRAATAESVPRKAPSRGARTIFANVRDSESGAGVGGAAVSVVPLDPSGRVLSNRAVVDFLHVLATAVTSADGTCELQFDGAGPHVVVARKAGWTSRGTFVNEDDDFHDVWLRRVAIREFVVVDGAGSPVAGAELWLGDRNARRPFETVLVEPPAFTDAAGRARLAVDAAGSDEVLVRAAGFAIQSTGSRDDSPADDPIRVELVEGRSVAGTVVDDSGKPLPGVLVQFRGQALRTATDGSFAFDGMNAELRDNDYGLQAWLGGWCGGERVRVFPGDLGVRVVLRRTATVRGLVVHEDGSPAAGARVCGKTDADSEGRFELTWFESGHELVWANAWSPLDSRVPVGGAEYADSRPGGTVEGLRIVLAPSERRSYVELRVVGPDGHPAQQADLRAWDGGVELADNSTDDAGMCLLLVRGRAGARVRIAASVEGPPALDAVSERRVETRSLPPFERVALHLGPPGRLRLRAVDPEGLEVPIEAAHVEADHDEVCGPDGTWALAATRRFEATVTVPGFAVRRVVLEPPHPRLREETIRLVPASWVTGRMLAPDGGAAAEGLSVELVVHDSVTGEWERRVTNLDAGGRFAVSTLPAGPARLYVLNDLHSYHQFFHEFDVVAGKQTDLGDIRLAGPTAFRGAVIDEKGKGIGGAVVAFSDPSGDSVHFPVATRPDGTFDVTVPGSYPLRVLVTRPGRATQFVATTPAMPLPVRVVLGPPGRLRVVEDFDHGPGGRDRAAVRPPGTDWEWTPPDALDPADPEGDLDGDVYGDLPPGPIEVVVRVEGQPDRVRRVEIVAGKTVECIFDK